MNAFQPSMLLETTRGRISVAMQQTTNLIVSTGGDSNLQMLELSSILSQQ